MLRALDFHPGDQSLDPINDLDFFFFFFFQLCFITLLQLSCRKMGARPRMYFIRFQCGVHVIVNDDFFEDGESINTLNFHPGGQGFNPTHDFLVFLLLFFFFVCFCFQVCFIILCFMTVSM